MTSSPKHPISGSSGAVLLHLKNIEAAKHPASGQQERRVECQGYIKEKQSVTEIDERCNREVNETGM